jgi:hypothetical protein
VEAFIRGDDDETLVGNEKPSRRQLRRLADSRTRVAADVG